MCVVYFIPTIPKICTANHANNAPKQLDARCRPKAAMQAVIALSTLGETRATSKLQKEHAPGHGPKGP
jgi:hypothetical protein